MQLEVLNIQGKSTGRTVELSSDIFGVTPNDNVIYLAVKQYLANQRQGTHKAKERGEVDKSTRKIKKQKGTGGARAGSLKNPQFKSGGTIFGPKPRDYSFKLNKKIKSLAKKSALTYKAKEANITVLENFTLETPKTKTFVEILDKLSLTGKKSLVILAGDDKNVYMSSRNLKQANVTTVDQLNVYEILHADRLVLTEGSLEKLAAI